MRLQTRGVNSVDPGQVETSACEVDGVFPDFFYSTTNLETRVRLDGRWIRVDNPEMDCGLLVTGDRVRTVPVSEVRAGDQLVCGASGVTVELPAAERESNTFEFMSSEVSSEKPQAVLVSQVAERMREAKAAGKRILWVGGPAIVHTGAQKPVVALVE